MIPQLSYKFYYLVRTEGETIANYVASLCAIAKWFDYVETLKIMLSDFLVCGINNQAI